MMTRRRFAAAILRLTEDSALRAQMGRAGKAQVQRYRLDTVLPPGDGALFICCKGNEYMIRENQRLLNQLHILTDGLMVFLAMLVSYWLRFSLFRGDRAMPLSHYVWLGLGAAVLTLIVFAVAGLYTSFRAVRFHVEASRVAALELLVALIVMAAMYVLRFGDTSRWTVVFFYGVSTALLVAKRAALRLLLRHYRAMGYNQKRVLLVGHGDSADLYLKKVASDKNLGFQVVGYVADSRCRADLPYCGGYDRLEDIFADTSPDEVVVALSADESDRMPAIIHACEKDGTEVSVVPFYARYMPSDPQVDSINGLPLINLRRVPWTTWATPLSSGPWTSSAPCSSLSSPRP